MKRIYERVLSTNILRGKRRDLYDPQLVTLYMLGEDGICMVNLRGIPRVILSFYYYYNYHYLASVVSEEKFCFVKQT